MRSNVAPGSTLIVGVSGGPDSMYLLHRCLELKKGLAFILEAAHVNHGLRGKESDADERFVKEFCKKNGVTFHTLRPNLKKTGGNVEEAGRNARYKFFETLRKRRKAQWVLTAHHLNDNIETMLFNLIRGAHFGGIKAMEVTSPTRHLLRPMLELTKRDVLEYLKKHRIASRVDSSNDDTDLSRNWLRKNIIPLFPKLNENFEQTFRETLKNFAENAAWVEHECEQWLRKNSGASAEHEKSGKWSFELDAFLKEPPAFRKHILAHLYRKTHGSTKKLTNKHLNEILTVLGLRRANTKKEFGPGVFLEVFRHRGKKPRYIRLTAKK